MAGGTNKERTAVIASDLACPLASLQCRALAALRPACVGLRPLDESAGNALGADWRKPAFACRTAVAQWKGLNARRTHAHAMPPPLARSDAGCETARGQAVRPPDPSITGVSDQAKQLTAAHLLLDDQVLADDNEPVAEEPIADEPPFALHGSAVKIDDVALGELITRIGGRDDRALAALYDETASRVFGLVSRMVHDAGTAEEVVEDTYWQVWRQSERFDPARGRPLTWLLAMARSRAIDAMRRRERRAHLPLDDDELAALCDEDGAGPPDLLAATRGQHLLHGALASLEAQPRQLIALAFFRGLTHEEIAACTQLPLGTVKSQIRRSLLALRQHLAQAGCKEIPL
jgi:RNA polymerase sigma factor (sigma-70 family)